MVGENGTPETPDWAPTPRAWDAAKCCPADCALCDDTSISENVTLGEN